MAPVRIAASILSADMGKLTEETQRITQAGVDIIHVDIMDGHFVPNLTFGPKVVEVIARATHLPLDVHLMIENPERWVETYAKAGAHTVQVHAESCTHLHRVLEQIRQAGAQVGVVLNPATPLASIQHVVDAVNRVLIMTVNPGFGGQSFLPSMLEKIRSLQELIHTQKLSVEIEVDGGIQPDTAPAVVDAGATILVSGSFLFSSPFYQRQVEQLRRSFSQ